MCHENQVFDMLIDLQKILTNQILFPLFILIYSPIMKSNNVKSQGISIFLTFVHKERVNLLVNKEAQFAFSLGFVTYCHYWKGMLANN